MSINFKRRTVFCLVRPVLILLPMIFILATGCISKKNKYQVVEVENPVYKPNHIFKDFEDLNSPRFIELKNRFELDTLIRGETEEMKRILRLRNWIKSVITIDDHPNYSGRYDAIAYLDTAMKGQGLHCAHFMVVQEAVMNAYGYVTRCLGAGPGEKDGRNGHHGINEIWSNTYRKWILSDAKGDHHFEKDGIPLSALEVRDEYLKNKAANIKIARGPNITPDIPNHNAQRLAETYTWISWEEFGNRHTKWPEKIINTHVVFNDDYFSNNIWYRSGKPHWAYAANRFIKVDQQNWIEWTPNVVMAITTINNNKANVALVSSTPNFKEYQIKEIPYGSWDVVSSNIIFELTKKHHEWLFRAVNTADVCGPEYRLRIERRD